MGVKVKNEVLSAVNKKVILIRGGPGRLKGTRTDWRKQGKLCRETAGIPSFGGNS
jgi:hypothetical protein